MFVIRERLYAHPVVMNTTNEMQVYRLIYYSSRLYMFRAMFSPIIRTALLYLKHLVIFTNVAAGWCHG
jgi:hypothetical protein